MKLRSLCIFFVAVMCCAAIAAGQNSQGEFQQGVGPDASGRTPITQNQWLEVMNQGDIFFDMNLMNKTAVLYMANNPVYTFSVREVKPSRMDPRYKGQEFVLTGNTEQRLILDQGEGVVFLKIKKDSGGVQKLIISRISVQNLPNKIQRFYLTDNVNLVFNVNHNNGLLSSAVSFKGVPIFVMDTGYEVIQGGRKNMNVLHMKGNSAGEFYFDRSDQTLYYKSMNRRGVWSRVKVRK